MPHLRGSRSRSEIPNRGLAPAAARSVHLQHINPTDAHRDAHIAASKAFVLSRERSNSEMSAIFPEITPTLIPRTAKQNVCSGGTVQTSERLSLHSADLQPRRSIRFVRASSSNYGNAKLGVDHLASPSTSASHNLAQFDTAWPENHSHFRCGSYDAGDDHAPNINKTWSGVLPYNKENLPGDANQANSAGVTNTVKPFKRSQLTATSLRSRAQLLESSTSRLRRPAVIPPYLNNGLRSAFDSNAAPVSHPSGSAVNCQNDFSGSNCTCMSAYSI